MGMRRLLQAAIMASLADTAGSATSRLKAVDMHKQYAGYLRGVSSATEYTSSSLSHKEQQRAEFAPQRLGVILPTSADDLGRVIESLVRWPADCPRTVISQFVDLVLYFGSSEDAASVVPALESAGRCFASTKIVFANLLEEEKAYPKRRSVQFYKMFLATHVSTHLSEYDALAYIECELHSYHQNTLEQLYEAAFGGVEEFWVKGSTLRDMAYSENGTDRGDVWHVVGHINGNAIYNNNDHAFVEYVEYTLARWKYSYPYDVALWASISDFPFSWQLWHRYARKFVVTDLVPSIHGNDAVCGGNAKFPAAATGRRALRSDSEPMCNSACGTVVTGLPYGTSTICDPSCSHAENRFGGFLCDAGYGGKYGAICRLCYVDKDEAIKTERHLRELYNDGSESEPKHVIMCDTMRPPPAPQCSVECEMKRNTICDDACGTGRYGDYNCNWMKAGPTCRLCFDEDDAALMADEVAVQFGGRAIMCVTHEPPRPMGIEEAIAQFQSQLEAPE